MQDAEAAAEMKKKRTFRKFQYRGIDLDQYVALHLVCLFVCWLQCHLGHDVFTRKLYDPIDNHTQHHCHKIKRTIDQRDA